MRDLVGRIQSHAPAGSILIIEATEPFDMSAFQRDAEAGKSANWDVRAYSPAIIGIWRR
jgi:hypothetical protein